MLAQSALNRGLEAHAKGRVNEAAKEYRQVLVHDSGNKYAFYNLGLIEQGRGRNGPAQWYYRLTLESDPNFTPAIFNLAIIVTPTNPGEAETLYRRVIELQPEDAVAHLNLGFLLTSAGKNVEGAAEFARATQLDPKLQSRLPPGPTAGTGSPSVEPAGPQRRSR